MTIHETIGRIRLMARLADSISEEWKGVLDAGYPFPFSFDELAPMLREWATTVEDNLRTPPKRRPLCDCCRRQEEDPELAKNPRLAGWIIEDSEQNEWLLACREHAETWLRPEGDTVLRLAEGASDEPDLRVR